MRNIHMRYVKLIFTLMLAVLVGACGESTAPSSSKNEAASTTEQSFVESKKRADSGDADAQVNLGLLYGKGEGVPQDFAQARQWYEKAATQGNAQAQVNLGEMYARSEGVPQDYDKAMEWIQKAAAQGHARAQVDLGEMYADGWGVPKDAAKAVEWYQKAAAQGMLTDSSASEGCTPRARACRRMAPRLWNGIRKRQCRGMRLHSSASGCRTSSATASRRIVCWPMRG